MRSFKRALFPALFSVLMADAIEVSPSTLDFGNVLMGNSPTMTFTLDMNLDQTITITAPNYYSVDITEIEATEGLTQDIVVTFSPPSVGTYNSYVTLTGSVFGSAAVAVNATAVNNIAGSLSGTISVDYSPYEISGDIWVEEGNTLTINPGVTLEFTGTYAFDIYGTLNSVGYPDSLIRFRSSDEDNINWQGLFFNDNENESTIQFTMIEHAGTNYRFIDDAEGENHWQGDFSNYYGYYQATGQYGQTTEESYSGTQSYYLGDEETVSYGQCKLVFENIVHVPTEGCTIRFYHKGIGSTDYNNTTLYLKYHDLNNEDEGTYTNAWSQTGQVYDWEEENVFLGEGDYIILFYFYSEYYSEKYIDDIQFDGGFIEELPGQGLSINSSNVVLTNSYITNNTGYGISVRNSDLTIEHSILYGNFSNDGDNLAGLRIRDNLTDILLLNSIYDVLEGESTLTFTEFNNYNGNPVFADELGHLDPVYSTCVDAGTSNTQDACMPPGLGTIATDIGMYGGLNNCGGDTSNIPDGLPVIVNIEDLPQDQGGYVGIQYNASVYDYQASAITHYSFWREMDYDGRSNISFSGSPDGHYYRTNSRDDPFWEWVGEMDAQGFTNYGYSAPTLGDSIASTGIFWSKYLVVAHTDDDDIFFVSDPDSGYSVDNIAPYAPENFQVSTGEYGITLSWEPIPENIDIAYYEVYKDNEFYAQITETVFVDSVGYGVSSVFTIRGVDENENIGAFSEPIEVSTGTLGDVTWDGTIDVLDVLNMADIIMSGPSEFSNGELWASDLNGDATTDIFDLVQLVDYIMDGGELSVGNDEPASVTVPEITPKSR